LKPSGLDLKCAKAFNWPFIQKYFDELKHLNEVCGIPVENFYNEKGCQWGGGKKGSS
jgi:hypothetical protein